MEPVKDHGFESRLIFSDSNLLDQGLFSSTTKQNCPTTKTVISIIISLLSFTSRGLSHFVSTGNLSRWSVMAVMVGRLFGLRDKKKFRGAAHLTGFLSLRPKLQPFF